MDADERRRGEPWDPCPSLEDLESAFRVEQEFPDLPAPGRECIALGFSHELRGEWNGGCQLANGVVPRGIECISAHQSGIIKLPSDQVWNERLLEKRSENRVSDVPHLEPRLGLSPQQLPMDVVVENEMLSQCGFTHLQLINGPRVKRIRDKTSVCSRIAQILTSTESQTRLM